MIAYYGVIVTQLTTTVFL